LGPTPEAKSKFREAERRFSRGVGPAKRGQSGAAGAKQQFLFIDNLENTMKLRRVSPLEGGSTVNAMEATANKRLIRKNN